MLRTVRRRLPCLVGALVLGACASAGPGDEGTVSAPGATPDAGVAATAAPHLPGLTASVDQSRMDVADHQVKARLTNDSGTGLTVRRLSLESTGFASPMTSPLSGIVVGSGRVVDLPVPLGPAVCSGGSLRHEVHLDYALDDGTGGTVVLPATDAEGRIGDLHSAECFAAEAETVAGLTLVGPPEVRELDVALVADLSVEVTPRDGTGTLELVRVRNTTLLQLVDPVTGERQPDGYPVGVTVSGDEAPSDLVLTVVPARCDAHAVAEDKQGTRFRFDVRLDGREGTVAVPAPPELTTALYDVVQRACADRSDDLGEDARMP